MSRARTSLGLAALVALVAPLLALGTPESASAAGTTARTLSGSGRFADLEVTVSQTQSLRNQVIDISWTGFKQTTELTGNFSTNYLQIMQCWGGENAPRRETCQFGGLINDTRGGFSSASRQVSYGSTLVDPLETYVQEPGEFGAVRVPFEAVNGVVTTEVKNEFFDQYSTNEIPFGRSSANGSGTEYFEIQTAREAPGLGCGGETADGPRSCWLVVVPRDDVEVNGKEAEDTDERRLISSPLSQSNWDDALAFKLDFEPLGLSCPIGAAERRLLGNEDIVEAVTRWQPALCGATGSIFGYSQLGDSQARNQVVNGESPWMSLVSEPVPAERNTTGRELTYAPVGISGIGIAFNIDRQPGFDAPESVQQRRGEKVTSLRLSPRLVAKLLTQSYNLAALSRPAAIAENPLSLTDDPELRTLNPEFADLQFLPIRQITNPLGLSDANQALWTWVGSDKDAAAFIAGKPDPWGMRINPFYQGMSTDRDDFPRSDPGCRAGPDPDGPLCPLDALAYAADFHDAGRGAARGDNLERITWDQNPPKQWKRNPPQLSGERGVLALVDTATAARYKLPMAALKNAAGSYLAPTRASMTAALGGLEETGVEGVRVPDPTYRNAKAYPLTSLTYAVTAPRNLEKAEAAAYAGFVRYATTKGQVPGIGPGQLPDGYVPLPASLKRQAAAAAAVIEAQGGPESSPEDGDGTSTDSGTGSVTEPGAPTGPIAAPPVGTTLLPVGTPAPGAVEPLTSRTPSAPAGGARFLLVAALVLGLSIGAVRPAAPLVWRLLKRGAGTP